ncbi:MAG: hypothetical protein ACW99U_21420 [Candidatus Thorarchaeota archaeon]|jgi:hypothetical protein
MARLEVVTWTPRQENEFTTRKIEGAFKWLMAKAKQLVVSSHVYTVMVWGDDDEVYYSHINWQLKEMLDHKDVSSK